jgi:C-terminal of Roc, COR, domain/SEFIR domain
LKQELEKLIGNGLRFPRPWAAVRQTLTYDPRKYITLEAYKAICREKNITDEGEMLRLSQLLHDLGVFLHFQERNSILYHQIILDRKWGTDAVYKILTNPAVQRNLGRFNDKDLQNIWQAESEASQRHELLELMKKFKVCYEIPRKPGEYIAPHLLEPEAKSYDWPQNESLPLVLHYDYKDFMPKGMMTRFIVEMHQLIENASEPDRALVWRNGVVLQETGARTEAIEHYQQHRISIRAIGSRARNLINRVHHKFLEIHEDFNLTAKSYEVLIPCNCQTCRTSDKPFTFSLETLYRYLDRQRFQIECQQSIEPVDVRTLIDNVITAEPDNWRQERAGLLDNLSPSTLTMTDSTSSSCSVFISYSHDTPDHKERVLELAETLRTEGIDCIIDQHIPNPKEGWPRWMLNQVEAAKFVLVVATETYHRRFRAKEEPGKGKGVTWEGGIVTQELYDGQGKNEKFIPIVFESPDTAHIPEPLRGASYFKIPTDYDDLYRLLTDQPKTPPRPLGPMRKL